MGCTEATAMIIVLVSCLIGYIVGIFTEKLVQSFNK